MEKYAEEIQISHQDLESLPFCPRDDPFCFQGTWNVFAQKHIQVNCNSQFKLKKFKNNKKEKNQKMLLDGNLGLLLAFI